MFFGWPAGGSGLSSSAAFWSGSVYSVFAIDLGGSYNREPFSTSTQEEGIQKRRYDRST